MRASWFDYLQVAKWRLVCYLGCKMFSSFMTVVFSVCVPVCHGCPSQTNGLRWDVATKFRNCEKDKSEKKSIQAEMTKHDSGLSTAISLQAAARCVTGCVKLPAPPCPRELRRCLFHCQESRSRFRGGVASLVCATRRLDRSQQRDSELSDSAVRFRGMGVGTCPSTGSKERRPTFGALCVNWCQRIVQIEHVIRRLGAEQRHQRLR
eukprot:Selendium_serpulae@DN6478_c0_g1_i2.p2